VKIRNRITLWITAAGLLAGLLFSVVISYEMIEQPYELLDSELDSQAHTLLAGFTPQNDKLIPQADSAMLDSLGKLYWLKIFNKNKEVVYASSLSSFAVLPLKEKYGGYNVRATIPRESANIEADDSNDVTFRVRVFSIPLGAHNYIVQIARPMERLQEQIIDLIVSITVGLVFFTIALVLLGYFAAGRILQPIADINDLARDISDKTLNKRIPLGNNKDELYTLSSSLNQMFDRLQFSFQQQKEFIANASHELKTPIAMHRLFLGEAVQREDLPEEFTERLTAQSAILFRMDRLVKNLLDLSSLELNESGAFKRLALTELISEVLSEFQEIIQAASIQLDVDLEEAVFLRADEEKLRRMFINLIDNAIKYNSEKNGEIHVLLEKKTGDVLIEVYNTGQGIPADELKNVFNQFYRLEKSRSTAFGGSGLGLTIVKKIVELHNGQVAIESEYGSWVRIRIVLPLNE